MTANKPTLPAKLGRPTKLTSERQASICDLISQGNYIEIACKANGIDDASLYEWKARGEKELQDGGGIYADFFVAVKRAEAEAEATLVKMVVDAGKSGPQHWPAAMTLLERRHQRRWGRHERVDHNIQAEGLAFLKEIHALGRPQAQLPQETVIEGEVRELGGVEPESPQNQRSEVLEAKNEGPLTKEEIRRQYDAAHPRAKGGKS